ncbi:proteophosphoglycan 5 [Streptomyces sp. QL37]|uniref:proteophosphoglycan 5 n=1 Tax=Streptomyces sp. QL37 TaxID=2093747 RepID=UPI000CF208E2|nr:proteophosphoglycan 5 [Streptomyces sp. QL37]PPQ56072.1 proteophosphoglycan 5 [Streptomyces sp. QL37]
MALVQLDLPEPMSLRGRWAALAAVQAAAGHGERCRALWPLWHYDDGHGSWADLHHLDDGRAVLLGQDRNDSETYYAEASDFFEEKETDLLAGAPEWWEPPVRRVRDAELFLGFVYGFDGSAWYRADYELDDGFTSLGLPVLAATLTRGKIVATVQRLPDSEGGRPAYEAIDELIAAAGEADAGLVAAVAPSAGWDAEAGAAAARAFLTA